MPPNPTDKQPRVVRDEAVPEGMPGSLKLDRGDQPAERVKPPTKAEIQWTLLRRLENAGAPRSKVTITRNAKHEHQYSVEVAGDDPEACSLEAQRIEHALAAVYPPPPSVTTETKK